MDDNFSPRVKDVISFSKEEALRLGHRLHWDRTPNARYIKRWRRKSDSILNAIEVDLEELRQKG